MTAHARVAGPLERWIPAFGWLRFYDRTWLRSDVVAGVVAGAVVLPQALAYSTVAGLPVEVGLYTCIVPMATYALLGSARRLSVSTTSTVVALTGTAIVATVGDADAETAIATVATLSLLVGLTLLVARLLRLGFLVEAVSEPVVIGLKAGVALTIAAKQLPALLGIPSSGSGFLSEIGNAVEHLGTPRTSGPCSNRSSTGQPRWPRRLTSSSSTPVEPLTPR